MIRFRLTSLIVLLGALIACSPGGTSPNFQLALQANSLEIQQAATKTIGVSIVRLGGFTDSVHLSLEGTPSGVEASFSANPITNTTSTLSLKVGESTALGTYSLTLKGTSSITKTIKFDLIVLSDGRVTLTQPIMTFAPMEFANGSLLIKIPSLAINERLAIIPFTLLQNDAITSFTLQAQINNTTLRNVQLALEPLKVREPPVEEAYPLIDPHYAIVEQNAQILEQARREAWKKATPNLHPLAVPATNRTFTVKNFITGNSELVNTTLKRLSDHLLVYVDDRDSPSPNILDGYVNNFEQKVYPQNRQFWGEESDVDGNGKIIFVLSKILGDGGYVSYADMFAGQGNNGDIIYFSGVNNAPGHLAHEFKHLIAGNQRGLKLGTFEEAWLEEGLANVASDLIDPDWNKYTYRSKFLTQPWNHQLQWNNYAYAYDAPYLFAWYSGDRAGGASTGVWRKFLTSPEKGLSNAEKITGLNRFELVADWLTTLMFDHTGLLVESQFNYSTINLRDANTWGFSPLGYSILGQQTMTSEMKGQRFFVLQGTGVDANLGLAIQTANPLYLRLVRFSGNLPYGF